MIDVSCRKIIERLNINTLVETGTDMGETVAEVSKWFAEISPTFGKVASTFTTGAKSYNPWNTPIEYPRFVGAQASDFKVFSVEFDRDAAMEATRNFASNPNIQIINQSSEKFLNQFVDGVKASNGKIVPLFFLDAHWGKYWPIRDELVAIAKLDRFVIVIDDFFVPGHSNVAKSRGDFGFDFYHDRILCWGYIHDCFGSRKTRVFYPRHPNRDKRGWCVITSGYSDLELSFLSEMQLFELPAEDPVHSELLEPVFQTYLDMRVGLRMVFPLKWLRMAYRLSTRLKKAG